LVRAAGGVDALDPERAEVALLVLAARVGRVERLLDLLLDHPPARALGGIVALGELEKLLLVTARGDARFDSHWTLLSVVTCKEDTSAASSNRSCSACSCR